MVRHPNRILTLYIHILDILILGGPMGAQTDTASLCNFSFFSIVLFHGLISCPNRPKLKFQDIYFDTNCKWMTLIYKTQGFRCKTIYCRLIPEIPRECCSQKFFGEHFENMKVSFLWGSPEILGNTASQFTKGTNKRAGTDP